jgi:RNA 3'-terminal phosphate cyclase (ATP)
MPPLPAALFVAAEYESIHCGFSAVGVRGKRSEVVAAEAVEALLAHQRSAAALDAHLADQILTVLALSNGPSTFTVERATRHLETLAWLVGEFDLADVSFDTDGAGRTRAQVSPRGTSPEAL